MITIEQLEKAGGKVWQKNGMSRVYYNDLAGLYGLVIVERYNTGNIHNATIDGERCSNSEARRILDRLSDAKLWYDLGDNKFHGKGLDDGDFQTIVAEIKTRAGVQ